jgi:hypothetical protein
VGARVVLIACSDNRTQNLSDPGPMCEAVLGVTTSMPRPMAEAVGRPGMCLVRIKCDAQLPVHQITLMAN